MNHDELLEKIYLYCIYANDPEFYGLSGYRKVLLAAMELHKPQTGKFEDYNPNALCVECLEDYPCSTIQAIEKELA